MYKPLPPARKGNRSLLLSSGAFAASAGLIYALSRLSPAASQAFRAAAKLLGGLWGRLWGLLPFPLSEWVIVLLPLGLLAALVLLPLRRGWAGLRRALSLWCLTGCGLFFVYMFLFGVHYTAPPLAQRLGLDVRPYSLDELEQTTLWLRDQMNEAAGRAPRSSSGQADFGEYGDMAAAVRAAYGRLAQEYPLYQGLGASPKQARLFPVAMSYVGIAGYYFPFTAEPVVSGDNVDTHIPFNIAHEAAHSLGVGPEDEANFSAFLACMASDDPRLVYSAVFNAYVYTSNALYAQDPARASRVSAGLSERCRQDIRALNAYLSAYDGPVKEMGEKINDTYIRATGQPDGLRSYGNMVDLLIAYHTMGP